MKKLSNTVDFCSHREREPEIILFTIHINIKIRFERIRSVFLKVIGIDRHMINDGSIPRNLLWMGHSGTSICRRHDRRRVRCRIHGTEMGGQTSPAITQVNLEQKGLVG